MTYISLAAHNSELVIIDNMNTFARYFCYARKQKHGQVVIDMPERVIEEPDEVQPVLELDVVEERQTPDEDDI